MSSYISKAINPRTGKEEDALFLDDYYGKHRYGVRFSDGHTYKLEDVEQPLPAQKK